MPEACEHCGGSGIEPNYDDPDYEIPLEPDGRPMIPPPCRECDGHGTIYDEPFGGYW